MVAICDRLDRFPAVKAIAQANDDITCSVGVHPHYAKDFWSLEAKTLIDEARDPKVVGIGETGLDQHYAEDLGALAGARTAILSDGLLIASTLTPEAAREFASSKTQSSSV